MRTCGLAIAPSTSFLLALVPALGACSAGGPSSRAPAHPAATVSATASAPAPSSRPAARGALLDRGRLTYTQGGKVVSTERFTLRARPGGGSVLDAQRTGATGTPGGATLHLVRDAAGHILAAHESIAARGMNAVLDVKVAGGHVTGSLTAGGRLQTLHADAPLDLLATAGGTVSDLGHVCALPAVPAAGTPLAAFPGITFRATERPPLPASTPVGTRALRDVALSVAPLPVPVVEIVCDSGRIAGARTPQGVLIARDGYAIPPGTPPPPKPPLPAGLTETEVTVHSAGAGGKSPAALACSLVLPTGAASHPTGAHARKVPAVTFFTGSGAEDRDEDNAFLHLSIFKRIAGDLGAHGIASLRCDDRGYGRSTGTASDDADEDIADATAQVAFLRTLPGIDGARIGVIGHSEGASVMEVVAARDPRIRALVMIAGTGRGLAADIRDQVQYVLRQQGASAATIAAQLRIQDEVTAAALAGKPLPADVPADARDKVDTLRALLLPWQKYPPVATLESIAPTTWVMLCQGGADFQVPPADEAALAAGLAHAHHARAEVELYPKLDHVFVENRLGGMADYFRPDATVDPTFLSDVTAFLVRALAR